MMKPDTPKFEMPAEIWVGINCGPTTSIETGEVTDPCCGGVWVSSPLKGLITPHKYIRADLAAAPKPDCVGVDSLKLEILKAANEWPYSKGRIQKSSVLWAINYLASRGLLAVKEKAQEPCEVCEGTGRLGCLPDDNEHTHPCDTCQPEANNEFQRGVAFAEAVARSR